MKTGPKGEVRPDDAIATAALTVRIATGELPELRQSELLTLHDHLVAWGEGRITHRDVMVRCQIATLEALLSAAFHSQAPFGTDEETVAVRMVERVFANATGTNDRFHAIALLTRRGIGIGRVPTIANNSVVRRTLAEQTAHDTLGHTNDQE